MALDAFTAQTGMKAVGSDGEDIGLVAHFLRHIPGMAADEAARHGKAGLGAIDGLGLGEYSPPMDTATWVNGDDGFVVVSHGGVLGLGGRHLYVPFSAVSDVVVGDRVVLACPAGECRKRYSAKPSGV